MTIRSSSFPILYLQKSAVVILFALPLLFLFLWIRVFPLGLVDDAYIPMVYARNIAHGFGIVFEPGGERVEGFTSPLWSALLTLSALLRLPLPSCAYWMGLAGSVAVLILIPILYRHAFYRDTPTTFFSPYFWPGMASLAVVFDAAFVAWSASGMETSGYTAILLGLVLLLINPKQDFFIALLLLVLTFLRPEGVLFLIPIAAVRFRQKKITAQSVWNYLVFFGLPMAAFLIFRYAYFGYFLPNSFYAKHDFGGWALLERGTAYVLTFLRPRLIFGFAILWGLLEKGEKRKNGGILALLALTQIIAVALEGGDHFALHRFLVPVIPIFSILAVRGLERVCELMVLEKIKSKRGFQYILLQAVIPIFVLGLFYSHGTQLFEYKADDTYHFSNGARWHLSEVSWAKNWAQVGKWLKQKYPPNTVIAVITAGAIPYYSELRCVDILGINNVTIAHTPARDTTRRYTGHEKSNPDYVLERKPRMIQLFPLLFFTSNPYPESKTAELIAYPAQQDLINHPQFRAMYRYKTDETPYGFISYYERLNSDND